MNVQLKNMTTIRFDELKSGDIFTFALSDLGGKTIAPLMKVATGTMAFSHRENSTFEYVQAIWLRDGRPCKMHIEDDARLCKIDGKFIED